jgi:hypothetical protein
MCVSLSDHGIRRLYSRYYKYIGVIPLSAYLNCDLRRSSVSISVCRRIVLAASRHAEISERFCSFVYPDAAQQASSVLTTSSSL